MFNYGKELDRAEAIPAAAVTGELAILGREAESVWPAVWETPNGFVPGYISEGTAVRFTRNPARALNSAAGEARRAARACCGYSK